MYWFDQEDGSRQIGRLFQDGAVMTFRFWNRQHVWETHDFNTAAVESVVVGPHAPVFDRVKSCTPWRCFTLHWGGGFSLSLEVFEVDALPVHLMHVMSCVHGTPGELPQPYRGELQACIGRKILTYMGVPPPDVNYRRWAEELLAAPPVLAVRQPDGGLDLAVKYRTPWQQT